MALAVADSALRPIRRLFFFLDLKADGQLKQEQEPKTK